jgi:hypothetical protein
MVVRHLRRNLVAYLALLVALSGYRLCGNGESASEEQRRLGASNQRVAQERRPKRGGRLLRFTVLTAPEAPKVSRGLRGR